MNESKTEVIVGAAVLIATLGFLAYAVQATGLVRDTGDMALTASFRSAEGVTVGTEIRLAGVKVGTVTGIALDPVTFRATTSLSLISDLPIPVDSSAIVASEGLLGGTYIEIVPGGSFDNLAPGGEIVDTQGAVSLLQLLLTYVAGGNSEAQQ
jgi:phospholipid/cholesterol/gamma-HCH transport system substrate-binding protein